VSGDDGPATGNIDIRATGRDKARRPWRDGAPIVNDIIVSDD
jgi:hypothetical protein